MKSPILTFEILDQIISLYYDMFQSKKVIDPKNENLDNKHFYQKNETNWV